METPFKIQFDFPLEHSSIVIKLEAVATLHHSVPYYKINGFNYTNHLIDNEMSVLPEQEILRKEKDGQQRWVHKDSERETQLSNAIGTAIEKELEEKVNKV
jgi:hypothetical protein